MPKLPDHRRSAAAALTAVAPLAARWVERVLASHDPPLTVAQYLALRAIAKEPLSGTELARRTGVSGAAVSQLVSALEEARLVVRRQGADDRRSYGLVLTSRGARALESATALASERLAEILADLPRPESDALVKLLDRVEAALLGKPPPRRPPPPPRPGPPRLRR